MLDRLQRHADARHRADLARPLPGAIDDLLAGDGARAGADADDAAILDVEALDAHAFDDPGAMHARALGERLRDVGGARLTVGRQNVAPTRSDTSIRGHIFFTSCGDRRCMSMPKLRAVVARRLILDPAILVAGEPQAARHLPAGGKAGFLIELLVEIDGVFEHLGDRGRRAQLSDEARGMPGRARGELVLLEQQDVASCDRAPDDRRSSSR